VSVQAGQAGWSDIGQADKSGAALASLTLRRIRRDRPTACGCALLVPSAYRASGKWCVARRLREAYNGRVMNMRTFLGLTIVTWCLLVVPATAQSSSSGDSLAELLQPQSELSIELALTDTQLEKVTKIREWERNDIKLVGQKRMISKAKRDRLIREAREKYTKDVRKVLTDEQLAKLDAHPGK
jgi:hypothetical protein